MKLENPAFDTLKHFYFSINDVRDDSAEIEVVEVVADDFNYMSKVDFANAISILTTSEFGRYIQAINDRNYFETERDNLLEAVIHGDNEMTVDLTNTAYEAGRLFERVRSLRDFIIDKVGEKNWNNACIVYSALYDVNKHEIS